MRVYVAAPYADAVYVREHVHETLRYFGFEPASRWAEQATDAESFERYSPADLRLFAEANDRDVETSVAVLVIAREHAGGEMFAEARYALTLRKPVVWIGRKILSAWRHGVERAEDLDDAISKLLTIRALRGER